MKDKPGELPFLWLLFVYAVTSLHFSPSYFFFHVRCDLEWNKYRAQSFNRSGFDLPPLRWELTLKGNIDSWIGGLLTPTRKKKRIELTIGPFFYLWPGAIIYWKKEEIRKWLNFFFVPQPVSALCLSTSL